MPEPIVYISRWHIKEGRFADWEAMVRQATGRLEEAKPRTLSFLIYVGDDRRDLTIIHVFADAASFDAHLEGSGQRAQAAYELIEPVAFEMYGTPSDAAWESFQDILQAGHPFERQPRFMGGFLRLG